jgi:hypothetical protein
MNDIQLTNIENIARFLLKHRDASTLLLDLDYISETITHFAVYGDNETHSVVQDALSSTLCHHTEHKFDGEFEYPSMLYNRNYPGFVILALSESNILLLEDDEPEKMDVETAKKYLKDQTKDGIIIFERIIRSLTKREFELHLHKSYHKYCSYLINSDEFVYEFMRKNENSELSENPTEEEVASLIIELLSDSRKKFDDILSKLE